MTRPKYRTPKANYQAVCERSGGQWIDGRCEGGYCEICGTTKPDFRGLQFAHWFKHRKMGGTTDTEVHSIENLKRCCGVCHDKHDGR